MRGTLKRTRTPRLEVGYEEGGDPGAPPVILVHGFPDDIRTWDGVTGPLVAAGFRTLTPCVRGFGATRFLREDTPRAGQIAALAQDIVEFADALGIRQFVLVGHDWGGRAGYAAAALWPDRVRALVALAVPYGNNAPDQPIALAQARAFWYQWYFGLDRGRATLERDRRAFCRSLWQTWSPRWRFNDETFADTARSFDSPDFVEVVIHYYRHRWGNAFGDPCYEAIQARLASAPAIGVPTILICGAEDGANLVESTAGQERDFTAGYERRVLPGVGHFVQRERPDAVVEAVLALAT